jgi:hypothetical protein
MKIGQGELIDPGGKENIGLCQIVCCDFAGAIMPGLQFGNAGGVDVKTDGFATLAKGDGHGETDITEADD